MTRGVEIEAALLMNDVIGFQRSEGRGRNEIMEFSLKIMSSFYFHSSEGGGVEEEV